MREIAEAAAPKDFVAFGFTEHFQTPPMAMTVDPMLHHQLALFDDYVADVLAAKQVHPFLLLGAEVEYIRGALDWTREQVSRWPFDYLFGSLHYNGAQRCNRGYVGGDPCGCPYVQREERTKHVPAA